MYTPDLEHVSVNDEILFFQPMMEIIKAMIAHIEAAKGNPVPQNVDCLYAPKSGKQRSMSEFYLISREWLPIREYLMQKRRLFYFYEPQMRGLVNQDARFWITPNPGQLQNYAVQEQIKLNEFSPRALKKLPFQDVEGYFKTRVISVLEDQKQTYSFRTQECEKILKLVPEYLKKDPSAEISVFARTLLKVSFHQEVEDLIRILAEKILVEVDRFKKRIRAVHSLSMKYYFFNASAEEKSRLDCLVGADSGSQLDALQYIERRVLLSFNSWKPPQAAS